MLLFCFFVSKSQSAAEKYLDAGYEKYENEDFKGAILDFNKAADFDPKNPEVYYLRGVCKSSLGQKKEAILDFDKALSLDPEYAEVYYEKGYIFLSDQNTKLAIEQFNLAIKYNPEFAEAFVSRGTAKCMQDDKSGANADWEKAKELGVDYTGYMVCD